jgi:hypothetical protein
MGPFTPVPGEPAIGQHTGFVAALIVAVTVVRAAGIVVFVHSAASTTQLRYARMDLPMA